MPGPLDCLRDFPLKFQGSTGQAAGKNLTLFIQELLEEVWILVVNVLDIGAFETAILFPFDFNSRRC